MSRLHILKGFSDLESALWVLKNHSGFRTRSDMVRTARENGYTVANKDYEIVQLLGEWGIADSKHQQLQLTPSGIEFYSLWQKNPNVATDVLHGMQYRLWTRYAPDQHLASWAYQRVCDYLWEYQTLEPQGLVNHIYACLSDWDNRHFDMRNAAFDSKSVNGAYDWLLPLSPPVLENVRETAKGRRHFKNATFTPRSHCSPALFLMGLSWVAREAAIKSGALMAIDEERQLQVCRFCLLEESRFDFMLNETLRRFSYISVQSAGRLYVSIAREPRFADF